MATVYDMLARDSQNAGTLYASDGVSDAQPTRLVISNAKMVRLLGTTRGDVVLARIMSPAVVTAGQVINAPGAASGWFLVAKRLEKTRTLLFDTVGSFALLSLPYTLSVVRGLPPIPTAGVLDSYGAPKAVTIDGHPADIVTQRFTVRAGRSNQFNPLADAVGGVTPEALDTLYVPLGSGLKLDDEVALPEGQTARVETLNLLASDGTDYALQAILDTNVGSSYYR